MCPFGYTQVDDKGLMTGTQRAMRYNRHCNNEPGGIVIITKHSPFTGKIHSMDIPVTQEQINKWQNGELIQKAMPNLTPDQREFIMTGITPTEWDSVFPPETC